MAMTNACPLEMSGASAPITSVREFVAKLALLTQVEPMTVKDTLPTV